MNLRRAILEIAGGLLMGIALGLLYAWVISPAEFVDTTPETLRADFKERYRETIAEAYAATGNLPRARARLWLLGDPDPVAALEAQAQRALAAGAPTEQVQALTLLASALKAPPATATSVTTPTLAIPILTEPPASGTTTPTVTARPTHTPVPIHTLTPRPTLTPTATPGASYALIAQDSLCDANLPEGLLQVIVRDAAGRQVAGAEIIITWNGGEEHFFTGLKPELGNGYADFIMDPDVVYALRMGDGGATIANLTAPLCEEGDKTFWGSLRLIFQQP
ncbi:MAG: hypothetical protein D6770_04930 [Anaerolineae bacterium]|nr:MAG: hypothetical protein D6770_04930 [Anaerolineae bacterium]